MFLILLFIISCSPHKNKNRAILLEYESNKKLIVNSEQLYDLIHSEYLSDNRNLDYIDSLNSIVTLNRIALSDFVEKCYDYYSQGEISEEVYWTILSKLHDDLQAIRTQKLQLDSLFKNDGSSKK